MIYLTTAELLHVVERLREEDMLDALSMIHCHIGSQITDIRRIKVAVREATNAYANLVKAGVPVKYLNVGGGLGVDYDGSKTTFSSSMNYSIEQYAADVVYTTKDICTHEQVPMPDLVSESGRAIERGSHAELLAKNGTYRKLWDDQGLASHDDDDDDDSDEDDEDDEDEDDDEEE